MSGTALNRTFKVSDEDCKHIAALFALDPRTIRRLFSGQKCWILIRHLSSIKTPKSRESEKLRRKKRDAEKRESAGRGAEP
jgi:hypothetical protein